LTVIFAVYDVVEGTFENFLNVEIFFEHGAFHTCTSGASRGLQG
jgi:hypothetical protein